MKIFVAFILSCLITGAYAQYAPQVGLPGCDAVSASSGLIEAWAAQCTVHRGFMDIADPSLGYASLGDSSLAIGPADGGTVSLGDSGVAVLTFQHPIFNGDGPDFAVFENAFRNPGDPAQAFLELAFVEVSSDGVNYFRFPAISHTPSNTQIGNGDYLIASNINNLAGKYVAGYGTPFDLGVLAGTPGLNVDNITHVRLVDVVGDVGIHASLDSAGHIINDPYPTPFPSGGFDLDAVAVLHEVGFNEVKKLADGLTVSVFPNPTTEQLVVSASGVAQVDLTATLTTIEGGILQQYFLTQDNTVLAVSRYPAGMYYLILSDANGNRWVEKVVKR